MSGTNPWDEQAYPYSVIPAFWDLGCHALLACNQYESAIPFDPKSTKKIEKSPKVLFSFSFGLVFFFCFFFFFFFSH
jgi:hypothetical protein